MLLNQNNVTIKTVQKSIALWTLLCSIAHGYAQVEKDTALSFDSSKRKVTVANSIIKASFWGPGISYEKKIGKFQSLYTEAILVMEVGIGYSSSLGNLSYIHAYPALDLQYRYYYNSVKREAKRKRTEMNSLNYISGGVGATFYKYKDYISTQRDLMVSKGIGITWGLQRNYTERFSLDLYLGGGYSFRTEAKLNDAGEYTIKNKRGVSGIAGVKLGFWLNRKDK
jgi:hypothetical protein